MTDAIVVEGLVKRFGATTALDGVDLTVAEGSVLGLLGPNGAGKTTVVRILTTLLRADAGRAEVVGLDVVRDADEVRASIGLTGQYAAVDEYLTGFENLEMVGRLYHLPKARGAVAGRRAAGPLRPDRRGAPAGQDLLRRHAPAARHRRLADRPTRGCCSSTSRRRGSTRAAGSACGSSSPTWPTGARRSC